jgi:hypothetical protein
LAAFAEGDACPDRQQGIRYSDRSNGGCGEPVSEDGIMSRVWPGSVVEEHNLLFRISTLRWREIAILSRPSRAAAIVSSVLSAIVILSR